MPFDLRFTFTGMILYVPELTQLQLLLPKTPETIPAPVIAPDGGCSGSTSAPDCMEPHAARLTFNTAYLRPGSTGMDIAMAHVSLRQKRLDVPAVGSAYVRGIPQAVAQVASPVRQDVLDGNADGELSARIRLRTGGATGAHPGACWEYEGSMRRMSHKVEWTISGIDADHIDLPLTDLAGMELAGSLPRLYPIAGVIDLWVWHAPPVELPPDAIVPDDPPDGSQGHHFSHLRNLLSARTLTVPIFRTQGCGEPPPPQERDRGASTLSCTGGQAPVGP
ncbi:MAG TPA: hypothetical protein VFS20_16005 [Longimicrobium sp.]|nr:hypothetical protein [Longimicrobium sp.]